MKSLLDGLIPELLDPQARDLALEVQWWPLQGLGLETPFPVAVVGQGPPLLMLHGFDSSFLEFRRLAPLLTERFQLFIPARFGFGFHRVRRRRPTARRLSFGTSMHWWRISMPIGPSV